MSGKDQSTSRSLDDMGGLSSLVKVVTSVMAQYVRQPQERGRGEGRGGKKKKTKESKEEKGLDS